MARSDSPYQIADGPTTNLMARRSARPYSADASMTAMQPQGAARPSGAAPAFSYGQLKGLAGAYRGGWRPGQALPDDLNLPPEWMPRTQQPQGQAFDPNDPFKGALNLQDVIRQLLAEGGRAGVFSPNYLTERMRGSALRNADAARSRTQTLASLQGLDPMQYRGAMLNADIAANQGMVGALNEAEMQDATRYSDLINRLLSGERYGVEAPEWRSNQDYGRQLAQQDGIGGFLGGALGTGIGAFTGGLGGNAADRLFK
jgi:hypothetical protein